MDYGIILTGGTGSRLQPYSNITNKHLLPLNGKFIIDYPLQTLKNMGVKNLTVVLGGNHFEQIVEYLQGGSNWEMNINFIYQSKPLGIAHAINLCKNYIGNKNFSCILGDNLFENPINWADNNLPWNSDIKAQIVLDAEKENDPDITRFGVATIENNYHISKLEEKPSKLDLNKKNYPIAGCYLFDQQYFEYFQEIQPSVRGEYEIVSIIEKYHKAEELGIAWHKNGLWSDVGQHTSYNFVNNYLHNKNIGD